MKKRIIFSALAACAILFSACDTTIISDAIDEGFLGDADVVITGGGYYGNDTVHFESSIVNGFYLEDSMTSIVATIDFCANVDLVTAELAFPFLGFQINDTTSGVYQMSEILTVDRLRNFNFDSLAILLRQPCSYNLMVIAVSDTSWYVSNSGSLTVNSYPIVGLMMEGSFVNVGAYYFTQSDVERLNDNMDAELTAGTFDLTNYFHPVTINGTYSSRRTTIADNLIRDAFYNGGLSDLR